MAKKRRSRKQPVKRGLLQNVSLGTILSILIIAFMIYSVFINPSFGRSLIDKARDNLDLEGRESNIAYEPPENPSFNCFLDFDKENIDCGELITGTVYGGEFTTCDVFVNKDGEGWVYWNSGETGGDGYLEQTGTINEAGTYQVRSICNDQCITDLETVVVTCDDSSDEGVDTTLCSEVVIPGDVGDKGSYCEDYGTCDNEVYTCDSYWNWNEQTHECGCTPTFFCGQYCFEYSLSTNCQCPPNSYKILVGDTGYMCAPNGYTCDNEGNPVEEPEWGPFP